MSFPDTRVSLIGRLTGAATEADWGQFLSDYWGPVCKFAGRWGGLSLEDAEDTASSVFLVLWESDLLSRWKSDPRARLRTLLCSIARRLMSNRARIAECRKRILAELASLPSGQAPSWIIDERRPDETDAFQKEWVEELLHNALDTLLLQYQRARTTSASMLFGTGVALLPQAGQIHGEMA